MLNPRAQRYQHGVPVERESKKEQSRKEQDRKDQSRKEQSEGYFYRQGSTPKIIDANAERLAAEAPADEESDTVSESPYRSFNDEPPTDRESLERSLPQGWTEYTDTETGDKY